MVYLERIITIYLFLSEDSLPSGYSYVYKATTKSVTLS